MFCIFWGFVQHLRTRSFFLCKSPSSYLHQFIRFPLLRWPILVSAPLWAIWWVNVLNNLVFRHWSVNPRARRQLIFISDSSQVFWCNRDKHRETKFIISFCFAVTLSPSDSFSVLFDFTLEQLVELEWLMFNRHKRWFRSSRVKFPFVSMSASWFSVSVHLIWVLGSKQILSNTQSRATQWVLETCLVVTLLPFMIILITASLSLKIYKKASLREEFTFEETKSTLFGSLSGSSIFPWIFFRVGELDGSHRSWSFGSSWSLLRCLQTHVTKFRSWSTSANFDFGQFRFRPISTSANFDFGQFRLRPILFWPLWPSKKGRDSQYSPFLCEGVAGRRPAAFTQTRLMPAFRVSTGLHVEHRRPKAGDAPHEGLLKVERREFRCLGVFRCLGFRSLGL